MTARIDEMRRRGADGRSRVPGLSRGLTSIIDVAQRSHRHAAALLIVIALVAFLPGFARIPPIDRDEPRFAQATKQMLETGEYTDIVFQNDIRTKKPAGIYWLQAASVTIGDAVGARRALTKIWLYRIPSLIGAIGAVLLTYWTALAFVTRRTAFVAASMLACSVLLGYEARIATTDAVLLLTVTAAMGAMARIYLTQRREPGSAGNWQWAAIFWSALAAGVLLKGPVILMVAGLTVLTLCVLDRSARWLAALRPLPGVVWMIALLLPWVILVLSRSGIGFLAQSLGDDLLAKATSRQEGHGALPGYYFILFWVAFWPGSTLVALAAPAIWRVRREPGAQFLLAWLVPSWIVFELVITKLPHYVLPLYPAVSILTAGVLESGILSKSRWLVRGTVGWFLFPLIVGGGAVALLIYFERDPGFAAWPFAAAALIAGLFAWRLYEVDGAERSLVRAGVASLLISVAIYAVIFPSLPSLFPSQRLAQLLRDPAIAAACPDAMFASAGYHEPSLVFLLGTETLLVDGADAAEFLNRGPCRFALVDGRNDRSFAQRADALGVRYALASRVEGYNISGGRAVSISVYRSESTP